MSEFINLRTALGNQSDLTTPTSTQVYRLGTIIETIDEDAKCINKYIYVKSHGTLTQYQPYVVNNSGTDGSEWITAAPSTLASASVLVCVPQVAFTSGYYGFVQIEGESTAKVSAAATAGNEISVYNAHTSFTTTTGARDVNTCGYVITATTAAASTSVLLSGFRVEVVST